MSALFEKCLVTTIYLVFLLGSCLPAPLFGEEGEKLFPEKIYLRDPKVSDFTGNFFYYLNPADHRIYIKPRQQGESRYLIDGELQQVPAAAGGWLLHDRSGGPELPAGRTIEEISVACEILVAVDDQGRGYLYQPTYYDLPTKWQDLLGPVEQFPFLYELHLPANNRDWSFSCSTRVNPEIRRTAEFMHPDDIIEYYEDSEGKKIEFGLTATIYTVSDDGRLIYYWDTGLAPSFSRAFRSPHQGDFIIEKLSAAGSIVMVIGHEANGAIGLYTRMYDYEMNGACPGGRFSFEPTEQASCKEVLGIMTAWRRLPLEGWGKVPLPLLKGKAKLSNRISLITTGKGNGARELRIEGTNAQGKSGYYGKGIKDQAWKFFITNEPIRGTFIKDEGPETAAAKSKLANDFSGTLKLVFDQSYPIELFGFHHFQSVEEPATLRVHLPEKKYFDLTLHTVDAFTAFPQKLRAESFVGSEEGEEKVLMGTLRIPPGSKLPTGEKYTKLREALRKLHREVHTLEVYATDKHISISSQWFIRNFSGPLTYKPMPMLTMELENKQEPANSPFMALAEEAKLLWPPTGTTALLTEKIALNKLRLNYVQGLPTAFQREHRKNSLLYLIVFILIKILNPFINVFALENMLPELGAVSKTQPYLAYPHLRGNLSRSYQGDGGKLSYYKAVALLKSRIKEYENILENKSR